MKKLVFFLFAISMIGCKEKKVKREVPEVVQIQLPAPVNHRVIDTLIIDTSEVDIFNELDNRSTTFRDSIAEADDMTQLPVDFKAFYRKMTTDSIFQKQSIDEQAFIGAISECDSTIVLNKDNWIFDPLLPLESMDKKRIEIDDEIWILRPYISKGKILFEYEIEGLGPVQTIGFEKINGIWKFTLYTLSVC